ncbi:hypothetical protein ACIBTZ_32675 [Micromonospora sp. NPDC049460]|uniref:hypothetical protein n=1 Tax=unclassified Micromonospora TaxID=2617518 RepID=UPI003717DA4C
MVADAAELLLEMAVPSRCGRVTAQRILRALGWQPCQRLDIRLHQAVLVIASASDGRYQVGSRGALPLPASVRRMCGIGHGQPVLLAALVAHDLVVVHPIGAVARLLADLHVEVAGGAHVC